MMLQLLPTGLKVRQPRSGLLRIPFMRRCAIVGPMGRQQGLICDISTAGAYVRLHGELDPGATVQLSFEIFTGEQPVVVEAAVMWQNADPRRVPELPPGCGLRFVQMSARDEARVAALVKGYTALPS
jgi:hypothetical protein